MFKRSHRDVLKCRISASLCAAALSVIFPVTASSHEDILRQIRLLDPQIAASPRNSDLLLKRADLFRRHQEYEHAVADFQRAAALGAEPGTVALGLAQLEIQRGQPRAALDVLDGTSSGKQVPPVVDLTRARALAALGQHAEAADHYARALENLSDARPDHYLEWANEIVAMGDISLPRAISVLDAGAERFRGAVTLHERAVELERRSGGHESALRRVEKILRTPAASPHWRLLRIDLLAAMGRRADALAACREAVAEMQKLPVRRQSTPAMQRLTKEITRRLAELSAADRHS
jgi:tetratricopeptide (TPR) repeat protein